MIYTEIHRRYSYTHTHTHTQRPTHRPPHTHTHTDPHTHLVGLIPAVLVPHPQLGSVEQQRFAAGGVSPCQHGVVQRRQPPSVLVVWRGSKGEQDLGTAHTSASSSPPADTTHLSSSSPPPHTSRLVDLQRPSPPCRRCRSAVYQQGGVAVATDRLVQRGESVFGAEVDLRPSLRQHAYGLASSWLTLHRQRQGRLCGGAHRPVSTPTHTTHTPGTLNSIMELSQDLCGAGGVWPLYCPPGFSAGTAPDAPVASRVV